MFLTPRCWSGLQPSEALAMFGKGSLMHAVFLVSLSCIKNRLWSWNSCLPRYKEPTQLMTGLSLWWEYLSLFHTPWVLFCFCLKHMLHIAFGQLHCYVCPLGKGTGSFHCGTNLSLSFLYVNSTLFHLLLDWVVLSLVILVPRCNG